MMFDPVLLRTFVTVAETLNFTVTGQLLGLSQPTVSQHIRKLEVAAGRNLVLRDTREVRLTDNGDAMLGFARSILAAHDQASSYFTGSAMRGRLLRTGRWSARTRAAMRRIQRQSPPGPMNRAAWHRSSSRDSRVAVPL